MTQDPYTIAPDIRRNLMHITMRGHWDVATVEQYERAVLTEVNDMVAKGCDRHRTVVLVDVRDVGAQSQDVIARYKDRLSQAQLSPRRLATLVSSALFKRQVERIAIPNQRLFTEEAEAVAWLLSSDDRP